MARLFRLNASTRIGAGVGSASPGAEYARVRAPLQLVVAGSVISGGPITVETRIACSDTINPLSRNQLNVTTTIGCRADGNQTGPSLTLYDFDKSEVIVTVNNQTLTLVNPDFGNSIDYEDLATVVNETLAGDLVVTGRKAPIRKVVNYEFSALSKTAAYAAAQFLTNNLGRLYVITDHLGRNWNATLLSSPTVVQEEIGFRLIISFEGEIDGPF